MALRGLDPEQIDRDVELIEAMTRKNGRLYEREPGRMHTYPEMAALDVYRSSQPPSLQLEILSIQAAMLDRMLGEFNRIAAGTMLLAMGIVLASGLSFAVALAVGLGLAMIGKGLANQALAPELTKNKLAMARAKDSEL